VWAYLVALSFTWFASLVLWSYSLEYTDVTSAGIFSRMNPAFVVSFDSCLCFHPNRIRPPYDQLTLPFHPLPARPNPQLAWYVIRGRHVVPKEFIGVAVALLGTLVIGGGPLLVETFADDDNSTSSSGFLSSLSSIASLSSSGAVDEKPPLTAKSRAFGDMLNLSKSSPVV
jgi:drug/metabolite transporter (DMT)-like permease